MEQERSEERNQAERRPPQFEPTSQRSPAVLAGALLWALSIIVLLWVIGHRNAVEASLVITFGSIFIWAGLLAAGRLRRSRREHSSGPSSV